MAKYKGHIEKQEDLNTGIPSAYHMKEMLCLLCRKQPGDESCLFRFPLFEQTVEERSNACSHDI